MRIHTDTDGRSVNAISTLADGTDVQGNVYTLLSGQKSEQLTFQRGAPVENGVNGTTNEAVLRVLLHRLGVLNGRMQSEFNERAIHHIGEALGALEARAADRVPIMVLSLESDAPMVSPACRPDGGVCEACQQTMPDIRNLAGSSHHCASRHPWPTSEFRHRGRGRGVLPNALGVMPDRILDQRLTRACAAGADLQVAGSKTVEFHQIAVCDFVQTEGFGKP